MEYGRKHAGISHRKKAREKRLAVYTTTQPHNHIGVRPHEVPIK